MLDRDRMAKWLKDAMPKPTESPRPFPVSSLPVATARENAPVMGLPTVESRITKITSMLPPPAVPAMVPPVAPLPPASPDRPNPYRTLQSPALSLTPSVGAGAEMPNPVKGSADQASSGESAVAVLKDLLNELRALRVAMERGGESNLTIEDKARAPELPEGKRGVSMFAGSEAPKMNAGERSEDRKGIDPIQVLGVLKEFIAMLA